MLASPSVAAPGRHGAGAGAGAGASGLGVSHCGKGSASCSTYGMPITANHWRTGKIGACVTRIKMSTHCALINSQIRQPPITADEPKLLLRA
jgi:hypothetical protein